MNTSTLVEPAIVLPSNVHSAIDAALLQVGRLLQQLDYRFTTVTPDTHAIVNARTHDVLATDLRGVFGWNRPFITTLLPERLLAALRAAEALDQFDGGVMRSRVRCSSIGERLFLHSGFPTRERDAVFFGPDTYRFVHLLRRTLTGGGRLLELGAGSGAAALCLADRYEHLVMTDINPLAVRFARINAMLAGCDHAEVHEVDLAARLDGTFDTIIANPPFIIDPAHRIYRDGGDLGIAVALRMVAAALPLLAHDGCFVLYTGAPVVDGRDLLADAVVPLIRSAGLPAHYDELDVDVFGSELASDAYASARIERLAVVALTVGRTGGRCERVACRQLSSGERVVLAMIATLQTSDPVSAVSDAHERLAHFNARRLQPCGPDAAPEDANDQALRVWEGDFLKDERRQITALAAKAPTDADDFVAWFTALEENGPGQHDPLFPWLAEQAGLRDMRWFLTQEAAGEAGFDDLVALTQVKLPERAKLELARNYWDEMGRGNAEGMHGRMLERLVVSLALPVRIDTTMWPALALGNLMVALATRREYAYHSIGALGVVELTAPGRVARVAAGLRRLGVSAADRRYFDLHAVLDRKHSAAWNAEVIAPLVQQDAHAATWIAEGALMRLAAGARCFACYRTMLVNSPAAGR